jgi:hypothetical protein
MKKSPSLPNANFDLKRSLNEVNRKKNDKKILMDNQRIAQRIVEKQPQILVENFNKDFKRFMKYRQQILKVEEKGRCRFSKRSFRSGSKERLTPQKFISPCLRESALADQVEELRE